MSWWPRRESRKTELENELAKPRTTAPDQASVKVLIETLQKTLDRQFDAMDSADRKAGILLGAILGIGVLNADRLAAPDGCAVIVWVVALLASLAAMGASLAVLWSRTMHTGPDPIRAAQATGWKELPFTQSVADSLAVATAENGNVNDRKADWLNIAFGAATIGVIAFALLGILNGPMTDDTTPPPSPSPAVQAPSAPAPRFTPPPASVPAPTPATSDSSTPPHSSFTHPRLGVAELKKSWDPNTAPPPPPPPPDNGGSSDA